jgi:hypothetical protein
LFISQKKFTHTPKRCLGRYFVLLVFIALSTAPVAFSQAIYGTLTGTIKDNTGALVPDVPITITNQGTRDTRNAVTDSAGSYRIVNILPGSYTITASPKHGFAVFKEQNLVIDINRETRVDISLQQSTVSQFCRPRRLR